MNRRPPPGSLREPDRHGRGALLSCGILCLWLLFLSIGVWRHCHETVQVPLYDAFDYFRKAHALWDSVENRRLVNPLNLPPAHRPPGTVLMSFPFGFDGNFHRFYFRSVLAPVLLLALAVYVAGWRRNLAVSQRWALAFGAILTTGLPFFYHFEWSPVIPAVTTWGLVDGFVGAVAALGVACLIRSLRSRSWTWWLAAALLANLTLFIKPSGALMMAATGLVWCVAGGFVVWRAADRRRSALFVLSRGALLGGSFLASFVLCTHSDYLDTQTIHYMLAGQSVLRQQQGWQILNAARMVVGYVLPFLLLLCWAAAPFRLRRSPPERSVPPLPLSAVLIAAPGLFALGLAFWLSTPEPRYGLPFVLMAVIMTVPVAVSLVPALPRAVNAGIALLVLAQALNLGALLVAPHPSARWQELSGVNVTSTGYRSEVAAAGRFLAALRAQGSGASLYSFYSGAPVFAFEAVGNFAAAFEPALPGFTVRSPVTWLTRHVFRLEQLIDSDYLLFTPENDAVRRAALLSRRTVADFSEESALLHSWFSERTESDGLRVEFETPELRLVKVADRGKLRKALDGLLRRHAWPEFFQLVNQRRWWSRQQVEEACALHPPALRDLRFADRFTVPAVAVSRHKDLTVVRVWWKPDRSEDLPGCDLFLHFLDGRGEILNAQTISTAGRRAVAADAGHDVALDVVVFPDPRADAETLGLGIAVNGESLPADRGRRDWGGRRVLLGLH